MYLKDTEESLTRIGPRTPMGELLRRFWVPALHEHELSKYGGDPVEIKLFGEELQADYVDGQISITDRYFKEMGSYPVMTGGGIVWTYMGPHGFTPQLPGFAWLALPPLKRSTAKRIEQHNWVYTIETSLGADTRPDFLPPFYTSAGPDRGHAHVPMDDAHTCVWSFGPDTHHLKEDPALVPDAEAVMNFHHSMIVMAREHARGHLPEAASHGEWYAVRPFPGNR
jgi:hypothetical protein